MIAQFKLSLLLDLLLLLLLLRNMVFLNDWEQSNLEKCVVSVPLIMKQERIFWFTTPNVRGFNPTLTHVQ